jgi:two-component system, chemotaxis family, response regulator Rcp1
MENRGYKSINILIVEDNPGDIRLITEVLKDNKIFCSVNTVNDGVDAMDYLNARGNFKMAVRPDIIILDLNLPKKDGREVLAEIKSDERLKYIPVVVMTISQSEEDIFKSYNLHANCYVTKPIDLNQFIKVINFIVEFWFSIVKLPSGMNRS